jgi:hypothetical protein
VEGQVEEPPVDREFGIGCHLSNGLQKCGVKYEKNLKNGIFLR